MDNLIKNGDMELFPSGVFKHILNEVKKSCSEVDITVNEQLVAVLIKLLSLDPSHGLHLDGNLDRRSLGSFVNKCVDRLSDKTCGLYLTLSMQIYFTEHKIDIDRISQKNRQQLCENTAALTKEIISGEYKSQFEQEKLLKKIAVDILVNTSMGNPINGKLVQETLSALKSVLSKNEVASFIALKGMDRMASLEGLREVVCGILIFNRDNGFYVEDKIDAEKMIQSGYTTTRSQLNISQNEVRSRLNLLSTVLSQCIIIINNEIKLDEQFNMMDPVIFSKLVKILILFRQHEVYVANLSKNLAEAKLIIDTSLKAFHDKLRHIHELVKFRTAIPTEKIFPEFTMLAQHWLRLQDLILLLSEINIVNEELMKCSDNIHSWEDIAYVLLSDTAIESDLERMKHFQNLKIDLFSGEVSVRKYSSDIKIENNGFCTWCLVTGRGLLIPSTLSIGVCQYKKKFYGFISRFAAEQFKNQPEKYLFSIIEIARCNPELIIFLDKFDLLKLHRNELHYVGSRSSILPIKAIDAGTQTDVHPVPSKIDRSYHWNIWDLRRQAIKLTNLMQSQTCSTQTRISYGNFDANTQTTSARNDETQTRRHVDTDMPKLTSLHSFIRDIDFGGVSGEMEGVDPKSVERGKTSWFLDDECEEK